MVEGVSVGVGKELKVANGLGVTVAVGLGLTELEEDGVAVGVELERAVGEKIIVGEEEGEKLVTLGLGLRQSSKVLAAGWLMVV